MNDNEILWTAHDAAEATKGQLLGANTDWHATGLAMDSRLVKAGDLFIALVPDTEGDKYRTSGLDGHDFVQQAMDNGAVAVIVSKPVADHIPQLLVSDTMQALESLGQAARQRAALADVIAITGSVGKTGTRAFFECAYGIDHKVHASIKSFNNSIGVPYSLATMPESSNVGVFEVGMNYSHEITPLSKQIKPTIAVITWIAPVHVENFDNGIDGVVAAKSEIFNGMDRDGVTILPRDNDHFDTLVANAKNQGLEKIYSFGEHEDADARLMDYKLGANGTEVKASIMGQDVSYTLQIAGKHIAMNSLSVLMAVYVSGGDIHHAAQAMGSIEPQEGRGNRVHIETAEARNPILLIDESYNASPVAMRASFQVMAMVHPGHGGRRLAVLGDMLELGAQSQSDHENLAEDLRAANVDLLYCSGRDMKFLYNKMPDANQGGWYENSTELADAIMNDLMPGDVILVKGSLGSKMKIVVEAIKAGSERKKQNAL